MIRSRYSKWTTRVLLFAGTFTLVFAISEVFEALGTTLFSGVVEILVWTLAATVIALFLAERGAFETSENNAASRAMTVVFPRRKGRAGTEEVTGDDLDTLGRMIRQIALGGTIALVLLAVLSVMYASSVHARGAWLALAALCIVFTALLWVTRWVVLRRVRQAKARLYGSDDAGGDAA